MTEFRTRRTGELVAKTDVERTIEHYLKDPGYDPFAAHSPAMERHEFNRLKRIEEDRFHKMAAALPWHADLEYDSYEDVANATVHGLAPVDVRVYTNGPQGGNYSHGSRAGVTITYPSGGMYSFTSSEDGVEIDVEGDSEGESLGHALKFAGEYILERFKKNV